MYEVMKAIKKHLSKLLAKSANRKESSSFVISVMGHVNILNFKEGSFLLYANFVSP